jgi:hypothetical protein
MSILTFPENTSVSEDEYVATEQAVGNRVHRARSKPSALKVLPTGAGASRTLADIAADAVTSAVAGVAASYKIARGQHTTVDADDTVVTGLATVVAAVASLDSDPVAGAQSVTCTIGDQAGAPAAGSIQIKTWKATAADNTALIAGTTFSKLVNWIAVGT